jgi:hypothetical protein
VYAVTRLPRVSPGSRSLRKRSKLVSLSMKHSRPRRTLGGNVDRSHSSGLALAPISAHPDPCEKLTQYQI